MKILAFTFEVATTTAKNMYLPAPCRGNIASCKACYGAESDLDEIITIVHNATDVATITPLANGTAAGVMIEGIMDTTVANAQLIFDPDSATAAERMIKIEVTNATDAACTIGLIIEFDDSAYVTQAASEA